MEPESLGQYYDEEMPKPELRNTGVLYEQYLYSLYRDMGMVPVGFSPPKIGGHGIDLKLFIKNYTINQAVKRIANIASLGGGEDIGSEQGVELKTSLDDDYGSSALSYIYAQKKWILTGKMSVENVENRKLLTAANVMQAINDKWKGEPKRFRYKSGTPTSLPKEAKEHDIAMFPEITMPINGIENACANYYTAKQCNYINISSHGLYYFNKDPLGLSITYGVRKFSSSVSQMGIRFRPKMGGSFGFAVSMKIIGTLTSSPVNLNDKGFANELRDDAMMCRNTTYPLKQYRKGFRL